MPRGHDVLGQSQNIVPPRISSYIGYQRAENFSSPGGAVSGKRHLYAFGKEAAVVNAANGRIAYRFHARDLNLIMGPAVRAASVRFRVLIDGQPPGAAHGVDVDGQGNGTVSESRLYQPIRQPKPIAARARGV